MTNKDLLGISISVVVCALGVFYIGFAVMRYHERIDDLQTRPQTGYERNKARFDRLHREVQDIKREIEQFKAESKAVE